MIHMFDTEHTNYAHLYDVHFLRSQIISFSLNQFNKVLYEKNIQLYSK